jgi:hypothetical protein
MNAESLARLIVRGMYDYHAHSRGAFGANDGAQSVLIDALNTLARDVGAPARENEETEAFALALALALGAYAVYEIAGCADTAAHDARAREALTALLC